MNTSSEAWLSALAEADPWDQGPLTWEDLSRIESSTGVIAGYFENGIYYLVYLGAKPIGALRYRIHWLSAGARRRQETRHCKLKDLPPRSVAPIARAEPGDRRAVFKLLRVEWKDGHTRDTERRLPIFPGTKDTPSFGPVGLSPVDCRSILAESSPLIGDSPRPSGPVAIQSVRVRVKRVCW